MRKKIIFQGQCNLCLLLKMALIIIISLLPLSVFAQNISKSPLLSQPNSERSRKTPGELVFPTPGITIAPKKKELLKKSPLSASGQTTPAKIEPTKKEKPPAIVVKKTKLLQATTIKSKYDLPPLSRKRRGAVTLIQAFQKVLHTNPNILSSEASQRASKASVREARAGYFPVVDVSYGGGYDYSKPPGGPPTGVFLGLTATQQALVINQNIFNGFLTPNEVANAKAEYGQAQSLADEQINTVGNQTVDVYLSVLRYRRLLRLSKINVGSHIHTLKQMTIRFKKGAGRKSELYLARARLAQARVRLWTNRGQLRNAMVAYKAVVGEMPGRLIVPRLPIHGLPKTLTQATSMALRYNPSIMAAKHSLAASEYTVKISRSAFYPSLNLQLLATNNKNVNAVRGRTLIYQGLVIASWNLYRGGADKAALKRSVENRSASEQNLDSDTRNVLQKVKEAWNNLRIEKERVKQLYRQVQANEQVFDAYKQEFKIGKRSLLNVLDSENELFAAETEYINARYDVRSDTYSLLSEIGLLPYFLRPK